MMHATALPGSFVRLKITGRWRPLAVLGLLLWALCFQGSRGLWEPDEGRYVAVAMQMVHNGDWMHPQLHAEQPHYTKPPLTYWAIASSVTLLGGNECAARLPNALAYAATAVGVWLVARQLVPRRADWAALIYATAAGPFVAANVVTTDTLLACFETFGVLGVILAWRSNEDEARRQGGALLAGAAFGLAFFTKGPPGLLPLLGTLPAIAWLGGRIAARRCLSVAGMLAFGVIAFGWFAIVVIQRPDLLRYFVADEIVGRVASDEFHRNGEWYAWLTVYGPALLLGLFPWTHHTTAAGWRGLRRWRALRDGDDPAGLVLAAWVLVPLLIFCLASSRLPLYVLPLVAPLSIATARALPADVFRRRFAVAGLVTWCVVMLVVKAGLAYVPTERDNRALAQRMPPVASQVSEVLFLDTTPHFGLSLYGYGSVEPVSKYDDRGYETLFEELQELDESPWLLVTRPGQVDSVAAQLTRFGVHSLRLADFDDKACLYVVR